MTTRIPIDSGGGLRAKPDLDPQKVASQHQVTAAVVDQAVDEVLSEQALAPDKAMIMRELLKGDYRSPVAHAYYHGIASLGLQRAHLQAQRKTLVVPYVLDDKQVQELSRYAAEYKLEFRNRELHDHPVAAASRLVDQVLVQSRMPPGAAFNDIGGSAMYHAKAADMHVHICQPDVDVKDPARSVQRGQALRALAADPGQKEPVRQYAAAYLAQNRNLVCGRRAQECDYRARFGIAVHVYDIPLQDWPEIMENKGMELVEGCMLFTPKAFEQVKGEMSVAGARYEVDPQRGKFRMGFVGSPSWWYEHDWVDYMRYGVDQVLQGRKGTYSYKVTERRGDTIFFRIMRVSRFAVPDYHQVYRLPQVQVVEVNGFEVTTLHKFRSSMLRRTYVWPRPLWEDMLAQATQQVERGTLDHERMYNYYRTIAPRQTINAVLVAGGYTVPQRELVPLIVHVCLAAAASVYKSQASSRYVVGQEMSDRRRRLESTPMKMLYALGTSLVAAFGLVAYPLKVIAEIVEVQARHSFERDVIDWEPQVVLRDMDFKFILSQNPAMASSLNDVVLADVDFSDEVERRAPFDCVTAAMGDSALAQALLELFPGDFPDHVLKDLEEAVEKGKPKVTERITEVQSDVVSERSKSTTLVVSELAERRRDAVKEAIVECEMEQRKIQASCASSYAELMLGASPNERALRVRQEEHRNPDYWFVQAGVITRSVLGTSVQDFMHSAVYTPVPDAWTGSCLRPVYSEVFEGESAGGKVEREYSVLADRAYTGWVFTNDSLQIYNGPEIVDTLRKSLDADFSFEITLHQGPPGCGKTTSIVRSVREGDVVMCPVRKSMGETRGRILQDKPYMSKFAKSHLRTLDSYLVNYGQSKTVQALASTRLLADEVFMGHSGKWYAAAALLGVSTVGCYGDEKQIPHVPRAQAPSMHVRIVPDVVSLEWRTYRCPKTAVAAWGHVYEWKVRTVSQVDGTMGQVVSSKGLVIPPGCVMMGMYQADKKELRQMYAGCGVPIEIMTVHESEGNTYRDVWLHRFDRRKRTDDFVLYDKEPYALVALSRHTHSFKYVSQDLGDLVTTWIKQSKDVRRQVAAGNVESEGKTVEYG